jgi:hypothetical protein
MVALAASGVPSPLGVVVRRSAAWVLGALALSWFAAMAWWVLLPDDRTLDVHIPSGTAVRVAAGETVSVLPRELLLRLGDTLVISNADETLHRVGPAVIEPGRTVHMEVSTDFFDGDSLLCTFHPGGAIPLITRTRPSVLATVPVALLSAVPLSIAAVGATWIVSRLEGSEDADDGAIEATTGQGEGR